VVGAGNQDEAFGSACGFEHPTTLLGRDDRIVVAGDDQDRAGEADSHLRPEMNATVRFIAEENKNASTQSAGAYVPTAALRDADGQKFVFIAFNDKALKREVKVLSQRSGGALVSGLNGGETVITTAPENLKDGDKIKIKGQS